MTLRDLLQTAGQSSGLLVGLFAGLPVLAFLVGLMHGRGGGAVAPWRTVYALLVYLACVPGVIAAVLTGYALFFTGENLLDVNVLVYILPVASMIATLVVVGRNVRFADIPGFGRLSGLMLMIAVSFVLVLGVQKTGIWLVFHGGFGQLLAVLVGMFLLLKLGAWLLLGRRR